MLLRGPTKRRIHPLDGLDKTTPCLAPLYPLSLFSDALYHGHLEEVMGGEGEVNLPPGKASNGDGKGGRGQILGLCSFL